MRVYIAGKLNAPACDYIKNMHKMMLLAERLRQLDFAIFVPCLDILMGLMFGTYTYKDYFNNSQEWLDASDALYVCSGWETSEGTIKEIERARFKGIPVCFFISELEAVRARVEGRSNEPLPGLYEEPGEP
jgi:hypothetical protein